tara:strand:- start:389 stop:511 length:123 start_codon:yes stop_codon:yes gene_type:complete
MRMMLMQATGEPHFNSSEVLLLLACVGVIAAITWVILDRN